MTTKQKAQVSSYRTPVVTVLGHVDHGKTTLLDTIRRTSVASREHGGITQHIGAYQITTPQGRTITFIDTPGHEAFSKMRIRGSRVADIAVLVVAANDGVKPQTKESIAHIKAAGIKCVVALTKIDLPDTNPDIIKNQLTKEGLSLEENGGDVPVVPVSAKTGVGVDKLLDMILLVSELFPRDQKETEIFKAVVIESSLSKGKGPVATIICRGGRLSQGDELVCENQSIRVRTLLDWNQKTLPHISIGDAAEVLGWKKPPQVGSIVYRKNQSEIATRVPHPITAKPPTGSLMIPPTHEEIDKLAIIVKADTAGTLEAIISRLGSSAKILGTGVGLVSESDVLLAKSTKAIIINFNQKIPDTVSKLSSAEKVIIKSYNLIYELFEEIDEVVEALKKGDLVTVLGKGRVQATFPYNDEVVIGVKVLSGRIARGDQVKVMRDEQELGRARIKSLRHLKEDITKAEQGTEAGLILSNKLEILTGDSIISIG